MLEKKVAGRENNETSRLEKLEIMVRALTRKVLSLENEIEEIKIKEEDYGEKTVEKTLATNKLGSIEENKFENEKEHMKTKQTLLKFSTRIKKLMVMFKILKILKTKRYQCSCVQVWS